MPDPLHRIAAALERIADTITGQPSPSPDPVPEYPIVDHDTDTVADVPATPHVGRYNQRLYFAVCPRCPRAKDKPIDPSNPDTWQEYEDSYDLDEQRAALTRHLAYHGALTVETDPLPIWVWADQPCPRCQAARGSRCLADRGRTSTAVHAARWRDDSERYW
jgi:hypothetical protein